MHAEAFEFVRLAVETHGPFDTVIEIGGRDVNGSVRPLFDALRYTSVDISDGPGVDVVADAADWDPWEDDDFFGADCVVCCEVLEHTPRADEVVAKARDWLLYGGAFIMTCATKGRPRHSAVNGDLLPADSTEFYGNVLDPQFRLWASSFSRVEVAVNDAHHDLYAVCFR